MDIQNAKLINCGNDFYPRFFNNLCEALEEGQTVCVHIDCIGHTRNNLVQESYKTTLIEKYGTALLIERSAGAYSNTYYYHLKRMDKK